MAKKVTTKDVLRMLAEIHFHTGKILNSRTQFQIPADIKKVISESRKECFLETYCSDGLEELTSKVLNRKKGESYGVCYDVKTRGNTPLLFSTGGCPSEDGEDVFYIAFAKNGKVIDGVDIPIDDVIESILED